MSVFDVLKLLGGLALFLYGMRVMGAALKEGASGTMKNVLEKLTNNVIKGFLLGLGMTAIIQSSTATIVITAGLVAAGILTLRQSLGIVIGANVGTTITGQIIRLMDVDGAGSWLQIFQPSTLAPVALIIGIVLIMFLKFKKSDLIGTICMGFGILFIGLLNMSDSVKVLSEAGTFDTALTGIGNQPLLGYLIGFGMAFILQSSSASIGILQTFSVTGLLQFKGIYMILLGIYLGDCVTTAIVCWIGGKPNAKRVVTVNLFFNFCKLVIVVLMVLIAHATGLLDPIWNKTMNSGDIANANTIFNIIPGLLMLPMIPLYEKLAYKVIKDKESDMNPYAGKLAGLNPEFYQTPAIGFSSCYDVLRAMFDAAHQNIRTAYSMVSKYSLQKFEDIQKREVYIDQMADRTSHYLVNFAPHVKADLHIKIMTQYYQLISEFERLGDHAVNVSESAQKLYEAKANLSEKGKKELNVLFALLDRILDTTRNAFVHADLKAAEEIEPLEEVVDDLIDYLRDSHLQRLAVGECTAELDTAFINLLSDLERVSDICANVAITVIVRFKPELADESHKYIASLHHGDDEKFNQLYAEAHQEYFDQL